MSLIWKGTSGGSKMMFTILNSQHQYINALYKFFDGTSKIREF